MTLGSVILLLVQQKQNQSKLNILRCVIVLRMLLATLYCCNFFSQGIRAWDAESKVISYNLEKQLIDLLPSALHVGSV